ASLQYWSVSVLFFFFQAEDVIRDPLVTGVQTCALPISETPIRPRSAWAYVSTAVSILVVRQIAAESAFRDAATLRAVLVPAVLRSEERRVGKECRARWWADAESSRYR